MLEPQAVKFVLFPLPLLLTQEGKETMVEEGVVQLLGVGMYP